ncbi:50S ribosomal protein L33 [Mycoplasmopsis ciconiae]|uniref:Large ribosomal subunit protein bL33 n=1 Tax=Mycoplasmopsis ciconiae TaxID=561067 RepID=A0ABU7MMB9_9BACT|nr:50S ribosomal protein L33 [Mycoplasmopsis ciconiae]
MKKTKVSLACEVCKRKNYSKNKSLGNPERLTVKKFCVVCREHTLHKEEK